jgi:hypothetical protein
MAIIRGRVTIQNAVGLYTFAKDNLTIPKSHGCQRRIFKYYIETIPKSATRQYKPIPGIRSIHQILVKTKEGELSYRSLSCYRCENCLGGKYFECENQQYTGEFVNVKAVPETNIDGENEIENDVVEDICISDLISRNTVFAVLCNDPVSDFYLVKANSESYLLNKTETDSWGVSYNKGTNVVKGNYFEQDQKNPFKLSVIKRKVALVPTSSVIYILDDAQIEKSTLMLDDNMYQTLLKCAELCDFVRDR